LRPRCVREHLDESVSRSQKSRVNDAVSQYEAHDAEERDSLGHIEERRDWSFPNFASHSDGDEFLLQVFPEAAGGQPSRFRQSVDFSPLTMVSNVGHPLANEAIADERPHKDGEVTVWKPGLLCDRLLNQGCGDRRSIGIDRILQEVE